MHVEGDHGVSREDHESMCILLHFCFVQAPSGSATTFIGLYYLHCSPSTYPIIIKYMKGDPLPSGKDRYIA